VVLSSSNLDRKLPLPHLSVEEAKYLIFVVPQSILFSFSSFIFRTYQLHIVCLPIGEPIVHTKVIFGKTVIIKKLIVLRKKWLLHTRNTGKTEKTQTIATLSLKAWLVLNYQNQGLNLAIVVNKQNQVAWLPHQRFVPHFVIVVDEKNNGFLTGV